MIAPEIDKMAEEFGDKVILAKIDCTTDNGNKKWAMGGCACGRQRACAES